MTTMNKTAIEAPEAAREEFIPRSGSEVGIGYQERRIRFNKPRMSYTLEQLASGSYDVLLDGVIIAALVHSVHRNGPSNAWRIELLEELPANERPAPFVRQVHIFRSWSAVLKWLGIHERSSSAERAE